jgi:hypothetical protein
MNFRVLLIAVLAASLGACSRPAGEPAAPAEKPAAPAKEAATPAEDASAKGAELLAPFKLSLMQAFSSGMQQGPVSAIGVCRDEAPGIAASLSVDGVRMGRSSHKLRNPENAPSDWLVPVLESYVSGDSEGPQLVELADGRHGYAEPIMVQGMCLVCHGSNIEPGVAASTAELYPDDQATGFAEGDFRGVFWVEF